MSARDAGDSDRALVERIKTGDRAAFSELHDRYYPRVYRFAYMRTGNAEDAADIASDTFCSALRHLGNFEFKRTNSLYPWLHRIAYNAVVDGARARPRGRVCSLDARAGEGLESFINLMPDDGPGPQELVEQEEVRETLLAAISDLPADQGRAISYRYLGQLSIRDIACELDRSEGAVKSLLHRALLNLRAEFQTKAEEARRRSQAHYASVEGTGSHVEENLHIRARK